MERGWGWGRHKRSYTNNFLITFQPRPFPGPQSLEALSLLGKREFQKCDIPAQQESGIIKNQNYKTEFPSEGHLWDLAP